jgi:hypothetical protein
LQLGQEFLTRIVNKTGSPISNGTAISVPSTSSALGDRPKGEPTNATLLASTRCFLGIATEDIANDAEGFVTRSGLVRGLNLGAYTAGDRLWVTGASGGLTSTEPATGWKILAGMVLRANAGDGIMLVNPRAFELPGEIAVSVAGEMSGATFRDIGEALATEITTSVTSLDWSTGHKIISYEGNTNLSSGWTNIPANVRSYLTVKFNHSAGVRTLTLPAQFAGPAITLAGTSGNYDCIVFWSDGIGATPPVYGRVVESV